MAIENRVINGGFESGALAPWVGLGASVTSAFSHSGFFSAQLDGGLSNSYIFQFVPASPGENFEVFVSLADSGPANSAFVSVTVQYYSATFTFLGYGLILNIPSGRLPNAANETWLELYQTTTAAPAGTTQALVLVNKLPQAGSPNVLVDDVALLLTVSAGPTPFVWGEETIIWADSSAPGPGNGTPSDPYNSLQAAVTAATNSPLAVTNGMRARLVILIAANSVFNEDIVIPPARHVQLLGLGPWVLGNADLANFGSSIPRNITVQTSQAAENVYLVQGPAFDARPVTVVGTFDNGTSVSTHTNYTDGAIISGNITFLNTDPVDPFTTIEFQLLNARVVGTIMPNPANPHMGILNTYMYNSRVNVVNDPGLRIQRMVDCQSDGAITTAGYSEITNSNISGNVTVGAALADVSPTGIFSSQFATITWTGPLTLDAASNYYFVTSGSTLVGTKTILNSLV